MNFSTVLEQHLEIFSQLHDLEAEIVQCAKIIDATFQNGGKVLLMGNGGSAADAQHLATEFVVRYQKGRAALPAIALTTDTSILTAASNDFGFKTLFSRQIEALAHPGDLVIGISTSGTSENVVEGLRQAKSQQIQTIGLTGKNGAQVAEIADQTICIPSEVTARIQEAHILIGHFWCEWVENRVISEEQAEN